MLRPLVYIAGPLTSSGSLSRNIHEAMKVGIKVRDLGYVPIIPHLFWFAELLEPREEKYWLDWDLDMLSHCDIMIRLPGESAGADMEEERARERGIPVYSSLEDMLLSEEIEPLSEEVKYFLLKEEVS